MRSFVAISKNLLSTLLSPQPVYLLSQTFIGFYYQYSSFGFALLALQQILLIFLLF